MRLNRLIKILMVLANDNKMTVRELSDKFDVSRKTIYQDLDTLILSGIPVIYGQDYKGTVSIMEVFNFPKAFAEEIITPKRPSSEEMYEKYTNHDHNEKYMLSLWERFIQRRKVDAKDIDSTIFHSWIRCQQNSTPIHEIDPESLLAPEEIDRYRIENVLGDKIGKGMLLLKIFEQLGWFGMIYDKEGILTQIINPVANYERLYPQSGYNKDVDESRMGTNATFLSMRENRTIVTRGAEHYNKNYHDITCTSSPIYRGKDLYGAFTIAFIHTNVNPLAADITKSFARMYEVFILNQHTISKTEEDRLYGSSPVPSSAQIPALYGESAHWKRVINIANHFSIMSQHITIIGENGVGKQSVAKYIHAKSSRKYGPCFVLDGACEDIEVWREEIFGVESGDGESLGLFEKAEGGVLIIRYPHKLPEDVQLALSQYLKTSKIRRIGSRKAVDFDTRVIMTIPHLEEESLIDDLRNELLLTLSIQPLRERKEDIQAIYTEWHRADDIKKDKIQVAEEVADLESKIFASNVKDLRVFYENNNE